MHQRNILNEIILASRANSLYIYDEDPLIVRLLFKQTNKTWCFKTI